MGYTFTDIGKQFTEGNEQTYVAEFDAAKWENLPIKGAPFMQGYAVDAVIKEWQIPAKRVSLYGGIGSHGIYGIETAKQRIFFIDDGVSVTPLALCNHNTEEKP